MYEGILLLVPEARACEDAPVADEKLPTTRISRMAKIGRATANVAVKQAGTKAANVVRSPESSDKALERRQVETAEQIVTVLGGMKGAAMKVGQVLSFVDLGLVPEEYQEEFQAKLAALRDSAPTVSFEQMSKVIEQELGQPIERVRGARSRSGCRRFDRAGLPRAAS